VEVAAGFAIGYFEDDAAVGGTSGPKVFSLGRAYLDGVGGV
jgi:hypothetical protein